MRVIKCPPSVLVPNSCRNAMRMIQRCSSCKRDTSGELQCTAFPFLGVHLPSRHTGPIIGCSCCGFKTSRGFLWLQVYRSQRGFDSIGAATRCSVDFAIWPSSDVVLRRCARSSYDGILKREYCLSTVARTRFVYRWCSFMTDKSWLLRTFRRRLNRFGGEQELYQYAMAKMIRPFALYADGISHCLKECELRFLHDVVRLPSGDDCKRCRWMKDDILKSVVEVQVQIGAGGTHPN
jgi:hypothetical protein